MFIYLVQKTRSSYLEIAIYHTYDQLLKSNSLILHTSSDSNSPYDNFKSSYHNSSNSNSSNSLDSNFSYHNSTDSNSSYDKSSDQESVFGIMISFTKERFHAISFNALTRSESGWVIREHFLNGDQIEESRVGCEGSKSYYSYIVSVLSLALTRELSSFN